MLSHKGNNQNSKTKGKQFFGIYDGRAFFTICSLSNFKERKTSNIFEVAFSLEVKKTFISDKNFVFLFCSMFFMFKVETAFFVSTYLLFSTLIDMGNLK